MPPMALHACNIRTTVTSAIGERPREPRRQHRDPTCGTSHRPHARWKSVGRGQNLIHYRGQIEPPASLPGGAIVRCFGEVIFEERVETAEAGVGYRYPFRLSLRFISWVSYGPRLVQPGELGTTCR